VSLTFNSIKECSTSIFRNFTNIAKDDPISFSKVVMHPWWKQAMEEEMHPSIKITHGNW
jgi:hypothetical protein